MPHSQCPNIKNDILQLRSKIGELKGLKTILLQDDPTFVLKIKEIDEQVNKLIRNIDEKMDLIANQIALPSKVKESARFGYYGGFSQGRLIARDQENEYYHLDIKGNRSYPKNYYTVGNYYEDRAIASDGEDNEFHIDLQGKAVYSERYLEVQAYVSGKARVKNHKKEAFHIDIDGRPLYTQRYSSVQDYNTDGLSLVTDFDGNQFYIDLDGNQLPAAV
jgi:hypothetical protein